MAKPVEILLQKEMTRKEFLATLGFGMAAVMGFSHLVQLLTGKSLTHRGVTRTSRGYSSSAYGGGKG